MDQYWDAYSYCGADPVNFVDVAGEKGTSVKVAKGILNNAGIKATPELIEKICNVTIRNSKLAGMQHKATGVWINDLGFPDFGEYCRRVKDPHYVRVTVDNLQFNRTSDFSNANKAAKLEVTPEGYTWHHNEDLKTMELVPTNIHDKVGHTGSVSLVTRLGLKGMTFSTVFVSTLFGEDNADNQTLTLMFDLVNPFEGLDLFDALKEFSTSLLGFDDDYLGARENGMYIEPPAESNTISNPSSTGYGSTPTQSKTRTPSEPTNMTQTTLDPGDISK